MPRSFTYYFYHQLLCYVALIISVLSAFMLCAVFLITFISLFSLYAVFLITYLYISAFMLVVRPELETMFNLGRFDSPLRKKLYKYILYAIIKHSLANKTRAIFRLFLSTQIQRPLYGPKLLYQFIYPMFIK